MEAWGSVLGIEIDILEVWKRDVLVLAALFFNDHPCMMKCLFTPILQGER